MDERYAQLNERRVLSRRQKCDLAYSRVALADLHVWLFDLKNGFDPNQPRAPAGFPTGGQWTDANGPFGRNPVTLRDEEGGSHRGHAIRDHVGKTSAQLKARVRQKQRLARLTSRVPRIGKIVQQTADKNTFTQGSFPSTEAADKLVRATLARNEDIVNQVASGGIRRNQVIEARFRSKTGKEAFARGAAGTSHKIDQGRARCDTLQSEF